MAKNAWGFDISALDRSIRPQDDFFGFVNTKWLRKNPIPPSESRWGSFIVLRHETDKELKALLEDLLDTKKLEDEKRKIADFFRSAMDMKRRNALGARPLQPLLQRIQGIRSADDLTPTLAYLHTLGVSVPFGVGVDQDLKRSTHYILYLGQSGLGMPDRDYYLLDTPEMKRVRNAYVAYVGRIFGLLGYSKKNAEAGVRTVMRIETELAKASMDKVSLRDPHKIYNKKSLAALARLAPAVSWNAYFNGIGTKPPRELIVAQPVFAQRVSRMFRTVPLEDWKTYFAFHAASDSASVLSEPFVDASFAFYGKALTGNRKLKPLWRRSLAAVNGALGEAVGKLYVERYFSPRAKRKMDVLVDELFAAYEKRIAALDWMSPATKRRALVKLRAINRKIGYPSRWRSYRALRVHTDDFYGNMLRAELMEHRRAMKKVGKKVDRHEWFMTPQTVNAYYAPTLNEIVFPAAILQPPFFDAEADDALNYGGIGAVIGHEITHGFDDEGSKFGADGNLRKWWTSADRAAFERKGALLVSQYDAYEVAGGVKVNGKLTLGENIADLGGTSIAFDALQHHLKKAGRKNIAGFTPEQRFFLGWARADREHSRPEFAKTSATVDPHSPSRYRINGPASNFEEFYRAFDVRPGDGMYRAPAKRAKIW